MVRIAAAASTMIGTCILCAAMTGGKTHGATQDGKAAASPQIADLAWIAGDWRTTLGQDVLEETWNPPLANQMLGMFQWQRDGKIWLNEMVSITQSEDGKIAFRLRHFGPDMTAWEEKDKPLYYPLLSVKPGEAVFENPERDQPRRFVYTQPNKDTLVVQIEGYKGSEVSKTEYTFTKR